MTSAILFIVFSVMTLLGLPIALALVGGGIAALNFGSTIPLYTVAQKLFNAINSYTLTAIPLFMLAGALMSSGGISKRLIKFANALVGWLPGGLGVVTVFSCMLFGCLCGSPTATVAAIGAIMVPALLEAGYSKGFSLSLIAAAGMLGTIIPPSTIMITYASVTGASVGGLFMAGIVPGVILGTLMSIVAVTYGLKNKIPYLKFSWKELGRATWDAKAALFMPVIILGGIYSGIFTPTEAAGVACAYGLIVGFLYREMDLKELFATVRKAAASTGMIMFIVACSGVFALVMTREQIPDKAATFILGISGNKYVFLALTNVLLLIVGCLMDTTPAILIIVPILYPAVVAFNINPVHFGMIILLNLCLGLLTPPLGLNLFVSASLQKAKISELLNRYLVFLMLCCLVNLLLITYVPQLCMWLPNMMK